MRRPRPTLLPVLALAALACSPAGPRVLFQERSDFATVTVVQEGSTRCLYFGENVEDRETCIDLDRPDRPLFEYTRMMFVGFLFAPRTERLLMIGLGGGYMPALIHRHRPEVLVDAVEIDPVVVRVARELFRVPEDSRLVLHVGDGRAFVEASEATWDQVWLDAFDEEYVPRALSTREFLEAVQRRLSPGGVLVENLHRSHPLYSSQLATARAVFRHVRVFHGRDCENAILVCGDDADQPLAELMAEAKRQGRRIGPVDLRVEAGKLWAEGPLKGGAVLRDDATEGPGRGRGK